MKLMLNTVQRTYQYSGPTKHRKGLKHCKWGFPFSQIFNLPGNRKFSRESREIPEIPKIFRIPGIQEIFPGKFPELDYLAPRGVTKTFFSKFYYF